MPGEAGWDPLHVSITQVAHDGWREWCRRWGVSKSALIEAIGLAWAEVDKASVPDTRDSRETLEDLRLPYVPLSVIERAREIDYHRRSRGPQV